MQKICNEGKFLFLCP